MGELLEELKTELAKISDVRARQALISKYKNKAVLKYMKDNLKHRFRGRTRHQKVERKARRPT